MAVGPAIALVDGGAVMAMSTVAGALAVAQGERQLSRAARSEAESQSASQNALLLKNLIESLQQFCEAIDLVANFVGLTERELRELAKFGVGQELQRRHFSVIKGKSSSLIQSCVCFLEVQPTIASDLDSLRQNLVFGYAEWWEWRVTEFHRNSRVTEVEVEDLDIAVIKHHRLY